MTVTLELGQKMTFLTAYVIPNLHNEINLERSLNKAKTFCALNICLWNISNISTKTRKKKAFAFLIQLKKHPLVYIV